MKIRLVLFLVAGSLILPASVTAADPQTFPTGEIGDVPVGPGEGLLGACSVAVKLTARGLQLRANPTLGRLAMPDYPEALLSVGITGKAEVVFELEKDGRISGARVTKATNPEFGNAALASVERWKLQPLQWIPEPKAVEVTATFVFSIFFE